MNMKAKMQDNENPADNEPSRAKKVAEEIKADLQRRMAEEDEGFIDTAMTAEESDESAGQDDQEVAKLKDQLLRAVAEAENVRKRAERDVADARKYAVTGFARDMLAVGENLQMALDNISEDARKQDENLNNLAAGIEMTAQELLRVFENHGIKRINPKGERFDHNYHQAVAQIEDEKHEPGTVVQVLQAGYVIKDRLLRPAMVTVAKAPGGGNGNNQGLNTEA